MMSLRIVAGVALASFVPCASLANPGLHAHPHLANAGRPLLDLHPTLGLVLTLIVWAGVVIAVDAFARRGRAAS